MQHRGYPGGFPLLGPTEAGKGVFSRTTFDLPISEVSRPLQILVSIAYSILLYDIYVPDWEYQIAGPGSSSIEKSFSVKCRVRGDTGPACNAIRMVDHTILGIDHLYRRSVYACTKV